jgi:iron complex transport system substrate-binding protein
MSRTVPAVVFVVAILAVAGGVPTAAATQAEPPGCGFPVTATDATGESVTVGGEPGRVVALAPSAAQTMWEIGAESKVVGMPVNEYTASLSGAQTRTDVVGTGTEPVQSRVVALEPDLVLAPNVVANATVRSLRRAGLTVYRFRAAESLADVYAKTELTGRLVGAPTAAARRTAEMRAAVDAVERAVAGRERPDVYYALGGGWTAGAGTFIDDLIRAAGGRNVAAAANVSGYRPISGEVIAERDPDWIVAPDGTPLPANPAINGTTAVREGRILRVDDNYVNQPGPRTTIPLRTMAGAFHPGATIPTPDARSVTPTRCTQDGTPGVDSPTAVGAGGAADDDRTTAGTSTGTPGATGAGFTAVAALCALLVAGIAIGRRRGAR